MLMSFLVEKPFYGMPVYPQLPGHLLKCLSQALLVYHSLKAPGITLISGNAIHRFGEYFVALRATKATYGKNQIYSTLKA
jgi:hypothetical protein